MNNKNLLEESNKAYYDSEDPILTDSEFDLLAETGLDLDSRNFRTKVAHRIPMGSLAKIKNAQDLEYWMKRNPNAMIVVMPKIDGASISLSYRHSELEKAVTRGNGIEGNLVTENIRLTQVLNMIPGSEVEIRAEAVITKKHAGDFDKNLRNVCAGMLGAKEPRPDLYKVNLVIFDVIADHLVSWNDKKAFFKSLPNWAVVPHYEVPLAAIVTPELLYEKLEWLYQQTLGIATYAIDGLVLYFIEDPNAPLPLPELLPTNKVAVKFQDPSVAATVGDIEWTQGKHGKLAPVLILADGGVEIDSTRVRRISASNYSLLRAAGLGIGAKIQVIKANQIIPYVSSVDETSLRGIGSLPYCPDCGVQSLFNETRVDAVCANISCPGKALVILQKQLECLEIDFISDTTIEKLANAGYDSLEKLFAATAEEIAKLNGFGLKSATYLVNTLKNASLIEAQVFKMVGLKGLGARKGAMLLDHYGSLLNMIEEVSHNGLDNIPNFGEIQADLVEKHIADIMQMRLRLMTLGIKIIPHAPKATGISVCATGPCPGYARHELESLLKKYGYILVTDITKECTLLLCSDKTSNSSKLQKAAKRGIKVQSYDEFLAELPK